MAIDHNRNENVLDPTFELLWKQIATAYQQVANDRNLIIDFEHDKYSVHVEHGTAATGNPSGIEIIVCDDVVPTPPPLVVP